jgi:hypothetical protein
MSCLLQAAVRLFHVKSPRCGFAQDQQARVGFRLLIAHPANLFFLIIGRHFFPFLLTPKFLSMSNSKPAMAHPLPGTTPTLPGSRPGVDRVVELVEQHQGDAHALLALAVDPAVIAQRTLRWTTSRWWPCSNCRQATGVAGLWITVAALQSIGVLGQWRSAHHAATVRRRRRRDPALPVPPRCVIALAVNEAEGWPAWFSQPISTWHAIAPEHGVVVGV